MTLQVFCNLQSCKQLKDNESLRTLEVDKPEKCARQDTHTHTHTHTPFIFSSVSKSFKRPNKENKILGNSSSQKNSRFDSFPSRLIRSMASLLSKLNKIHKCNTLGHASRPGGPSVHTCPAHIGRFRPLGRGWLQANSAKFRGAIGSPLGVEGGQATGAGSTGRDRRKTLVTEIC